jgi:hypothetical protein
LKLDRKSNEVLWSPADRPAKPLATSDRVVDDIGAAFAITVKLSAENALVGLQLPHPQDAGSLPARAPQRRRGAATRSIAKDIQFSQRGPIDCATSGSC